MVRTSMMMTMMRFVKYLFFFVSSSNDTDVPMRSCETDYLKFKCQMNACWFLTTSKDICGLRELFF